MTAPENPWISWEGGECPVDPDVRVDVRLRDREYPNQRATSLRWGHWPKEGTSPQFDIIAYRVVSA